MVPDAFDFMNKEFTNDLVGQSLAVVELVEEKQPRVFSMSTDWSGRQATNHVTGCKSLKFSPSGDNAEVPGCYLL